MSFLFKESFERLSYLICCHLIVTVVWIVDEFRDACFSRHCLQSYCKLIEIQNETCSFSPPQQKYDVISTKLSVVEKADYAVERMRFGGGSVQ